MLLSRKWVGMTNITNFQESMLGNELPGLDESGTSIRKQMMMVRMVPQTKDAACVGIREEQDGRYESGLDDGSESDDEGISDKPIIDTPMLPYYKSRLLVIDALVGRYRNDKPKVNFKPHMNIVLDRRTVTSSMKRLCNSTNAKVAELLYEYGPLTSKEIEERGDLESTGVNHALTELQRDNIIVRVKRDYYITNYGERLIDGISLIIDVDAENGE